VNILIVDRSQRLANLTAGLARSIDCHTSVSSNTDEALRKIETGLFDALITILGARADDMMEFVAGCRDLLPALPILVMSEDGAQTGDDFMTVLQRPARAGRILDWLRGTLHEQERRLRMPNIDLPSIQLDIDGRPMQVRGVRSVGTRVLFAPVEHETMLDVDVEGAGVSVRATIDFGTSSTVQADGSLLFVEPGPGDTMTGICVNFADLGPDTSRKLAPWLAA
jgi:hypothetical protein